MTEERPMAPDGPIHRSGFTRRTTKTAAIRPRSRRLLQYDQVFVVALLAVVYVSWQCGFGPGIVCLVVSLVGYVYFFSPPHGEFYITGLGHQLSIALFFFCGVACAALGESQRTAHGRRRLGTMIAGRPVHRLIPQCEPAGRWLRAAPGPPARTAAIQPPWKVSRRWPTAYTPRCTR